MTNRTTPLHPDTPSPDLTLIECLSTRDGKPAWGAYVDPSDSSILHCLSSIVDWPFLIATPECHPTERKEFLQCDYFQWACQAAGHSSGRIDWYFYSDKRYNGPFCPGSWPGRLQALHLVDTRPVIQQRLDDLVQETVFRNGAHVVREPGILLIESSDPLPILYGALVVLPSIELLAWRSPTIVTPKGVEPFEATLSQVSSQGLWKTSDEWLCFQGQSLKDLIAIIHVRHCHFLSKTQTSSCLLAGQALVKEKSRPPNELHSLANPSNLILSNALIACASADWTCLVTLFASLYEDRVEAYNQLTPLASRLCFYASPFFKATKAEPPAIHETLSSVTDELLRTAFTVLSEACVQQSHDDVSAAIESARNFILLLVRASLSEGFSVSTHDRRVLLDMATVLPQRLLTQSQLNSCFNRQEFPRRIAFVLGMHRSGTSALTGMLHQAGYSIPNGELLPANDGNPKGYWELQTIYSMNNRLLADYDCSWSKPIPFPVDWIDSSPCVKWRKDMLEFLSHSLPSCRVPILKDPRFSLVGPAMTPWFSSGFLEPIFLVCLRHPAEVASSLTKRKGMSTLIATRLWITYMLSACKQCVNSPHIVVWYERLLADPFSVVDQCVRIINPFSESCFDKEISLDFIDPSLRNYRIADLLLSFHTALQDHPLELRLSLAIFAVLASSSTISPSGIHLLDELSLEWESLSCSRPLFASDSYPGNRTSQV